MLPEQAAGVERAAVEMARLEVQRAFQAAIILVAAAVDLDSVERAARAGLAL